MPSASGFIRGIAGGNKFTSTFIIDDIQYHYSGSFAPAVQDFVCNDATLEYNKVGDLTVTRDFHGKVGTQDITFEIKPDGVKITGKLDLPVTPAARIAGTGTWNQN